MIFKLIDLFLYKDSPYWRYDDKRQEIGNKMVTPSFASLVSTVSNMVARVNTAPVYKSITKFFVLSEKDVKCLHSKAFFKKSMQEGYDLVFIGRIINSIIRDNYIESNRLLFITLEVLNDSYDAFKIKMFLDMVQEIVLLQDDLSSLRLEWLFGVPQVNNITYFGVQPKIIQNTHLKIFNFPSFLLSGTNHDSVLDHIFRMSHNQEYLSILQYLLNLAYKFECVFNILENYPSPYQEDSKYLFFN